MKPMPLPEDVPPFAFAAWQSRDFLAVAYAEEAATRLTVNRAQLDTRTSTWREGITWDELQRVKRECGFGDRWAVEVYPADGEVVDVAAMRHLWLLPEPPAYAWRSDARREVEGE
jgi:hypothetical protein